MKKVEFPEEPQITPKKGFNSSDILLFFPEGIIAILFLLASPVQTVILFMHNRVGSSLLLMTCAATCIYLSTKLLELKRLYLAFFVLYGYAVAAYLIGMS